MCDRSRRALFAQWKRAHATRRPRSRVASLSLLATFFTLLPGCQKKEPTVTDDPLFPPPDHVRLVDVALRTQAAAGARHSSTLYDADFDGDEVNSLGQWKLRLMLEGAPAAQPLTVYVASAADPAQFTARSRSISQFITDVGAPSDRLAVKEGVSPRPSTPASTGLRNLERLEEYSASTSSYGKSSPNAGKSGTGSTGSADSSSGAGASSNP